jgi:hypothetical protein
MTGPGGPVIPVPTEESHSRRGEAAATEANPTIETEESHSRRGEAAATEANPTIETDHPAPNAERSVRRA